MRTLLLFLVACPALMADNPNCQINNLAIATGAPAVDTVRGQLRNQGTPGATYTANIYLDDASMTSTTDVVPTSASTTAIYTIANATFGTGTINPKDGAQHNFYIKMDSTTHGAVPCTSGNGWPYKYNIADSLDDFTYPLYTSVAVRGATTSTLAVIVNTSDTYSVGTTGTPVCTVGGTDIFPDGVAGIYIQKYGISCSNVHKVTMAVTGTITKANMDTAFAGLTPALGSNEQFEALAWMQPYKVSGITVTGLAGSTTGSMSVSAYFTFGGATTFLASTASDASLTQGQSNITNGMFRTSSTTPFTDYGQRDAVMLAAASCSSGCGSTMTGTWTASTANATTLFNATFAANNTNPTGGKIIITSNAGDVGLSANYQNTSPRAYGTNTGIAPASLNVVTSTSAVARTFSTTGILGYDFSDNTVNTAATPACQSGVGYGAVTSSISGVLDGSGGQTQAVYWLNQGCAFAAGSVLEPFGLIVQHYPDISLFMSGYTRGMSAVEAAYHSTRDIASTAFVGDPLSHPFPLTATGITFGNSTAVMAPLP